MNFEEFMKRNRIKDVALSQAMGEESSNYSSSSSILINNSNINHVTSWSFENLINTNEENIMLAQECTALVNKRSTDKNWKERVQNMSLSSFESAKCSKNCTNKCIDILTVKQVNEIQYNFWGDMVSSNSPSQADRKRKIKEILFNAFDRSTTTFKFVLDHNTFVCESAFLAALGLTANINRRIPDQWKELKSLILKGL